MYKIFRKTCCLRKLLSFFIKGFYKDIKTKFQQNKHCSDICQGDGMCGCFTGRVLGADKKTCKG